MTDVVPFTSASELPLSQARIAILGLGLMGGSLALALHGFCARLLGVDRDLHVLDLAQKNGLVDAAYNAPGPALAQADLVVLAVPVRTILRFLTELPGLHPGTAVVFDLGSTKSAIAEAMTRLPARFDPIGGHPMCGKEKTGLAYAEAGLFKEAPFALAPFPRTSSRARRLALEIVQAVGARPVWIDPEIHDAWVAATSHLPYLVASALAACTPPEAAPLIGPGYRSTSRLAASSVEMMVDILHTNTAPVLAALSRFKSQLNLLEECLLAGDESRLAKLLDQTSQHQAELFGANQVATDLTERGDGMQASARRTGEEP
jgi:prephenate dehydrogenase